MQLNKQVVLMPMSHVPHSEMQFLHVDLFRALKAFSGSSILLDVPSLLSLLISGSTELC